VLAVTVDTNAPGMRERDLHNGAPHLMSGNLGAMLPYLPSILARPRWLARFLADRDIQVPDAQGRMRPTPAADVRRMLAGAVVTWGDLEWIRKVWPGPIVAKGVITGDDARRAIDYGCAGVIVSNHGGRQLDTCYPTLRALPEVVRAVRTDGVVMVDGGIRRGADVIKALCMGAQAVLIGRAYAYGMMAEGREGVARAIAILKADLERTMILLGVASLAELDDSLVDCPEHWRGHRFAAIGSMPS
jgi:isopentenyl diphosphate isomerase/L-lactate dehydrogenase-like FMN-dependent dehydrogenase